MSDRISTKNPMLTDEDKQKIASALQERGVGSICPMCGSEGFSILDGYFNSPLTGKVGDMFGRAVIPMAVLVCKKCGFISQHALGALNLLPVAKEGEKK